MDNRYYLISLSIVVLLDIILYIMGTPVEKIYGVTPILLMGCSLGTLIGYQHFILPNLVRNIH